MIQSLAQRSFRRIARAASRAGVLVLGAVVGAASCTSGGEGSLGSAPPSITPTHVGARACTGGACLQPAACRPGQSSAQFRAQQPPPHDMIPGAHAWASVTFDNCSGHTWTRAAFALRPHPPVEQETWRLGRVDLPADVPDGTEVTIPFEVTAPDAPGTYPYAWNVAGDSVGPLEEPSPAVDVTVRNSEDCTEAGPPARFRGWTFPAFVAPGSTFRATLTFANCSSARWTAADGFELGAQPDDATWGAARIALPVDVPPLTQVALPIDLVAPKAAGAYPFAWKLTQRGAGGLDEGTPVASVVVLEAYDCSHPGAASRFVREDGVPGTVDPGATIHASVTFANCGAEVWGSSIHVGAAAPSDDGVWSAGRIALPLAVAPGFAITAPIAARAPGAPGTYPYRWSIVRDGVGPLDEPSPPHDVAVRCIAQCGDHDCGGDGCGGSCGACGGGYACDGAHCQAIPSALSCSNLQWWNSPITYGPYVSYGWWDTDLGVSSSTPVQLRHDSRLDKHGVYAWGYMPEFTDLVTGHRFRFVHLRPSDQYATSTGTVYPAGYVVGLSGGDTYDTGLGTYSTGAHLCVQTLDLYRDCFPAGRDACR